MSEPEARRQARIDFGADALVKEQCRDQRRVNFIETLIQDVRYALRGFRRTPLFALTVIATIALGLGINAAVFTFLNAYILRPLSVRDPNSLYEFRWRNQQRNPLYASLADYETLRRQPNPFIETFAVHDFLVRINGLKTYGELVTGDYFQKLGIGPAIGRILLQEDSAQPGSGAVVVLSYSWWQSCYGSDPEIVGKKIFVHGYPLEVVGIARDGFDSIKGSPVDFWAPISMMAQIDPDGGTEIGMFGWLKPEIRPHAGLLAWSEWQEQPMLTVIGRQITANRPETQRAEISQMRSRATSIPVSVEVVVLMSPLITAFALVLVIACANVSNMMLARAMARQREIGIRLSLGAGRSRLIRQLLTESLLLAFTAAALGLAVSQATLRTGIRVLLATIPAEMAADGRFMPMTPDLRVFAFMMTAAIVAAILFGLAPAMQATRTDPIQAARGDFSSDHRPSKLRNALVVVQIAGCALLLIVTGVLVRGAGRVHAINSGLDTSHAIEIDFQEKSRARILASLQSEPLVESISAASTVPLSHGFPRVPGVGSLTSVSPEFFDVFKIPILRGRNFTVNESLAGAPVAIVTETVAHHLFPHADAIGQSLHLPQNPRSMVSPPHADVRVIAITRDINTGLTNDESERSVVFLPTALTTTWTFLIVRVNGDPEVARQRIDSLLAKDVPGAVDEIHKMDTFVALNAFPFRAAYWVSAIVGLLALILAVTGIYGVLSYVVMQRRKEIGIRLAVGASGRQVVGLVLKQSIRLALSGLAIGTALALGVSRIYASFVDRSGMVNSFDSIAYAAAILCVFGACLLAGFFPSLRAARIDPITTLRYD